MGILVDASNEICFHFSKMRTSLQCTRSTTYYVVEICKLLLEYNIKLTVYLHKVTGSECKHKKEMIVILFPPPR